MRLELFNRDDEPDRIQVAFDVEVTREYTEHTVLVTFTDGSTRELTADVITTPTADEPVYVFKDYTGLEARQTLSAFSNDWSVRFGTESFLSLPAENVQSVETIDRTNRSSTETFERTAKTVDPAPAYVAEQYDDAGTVIEHTVEVIDDE